MLLNPSFHFETYLEQVGSVQYSGRAFLGQASWSVAGTRRPTFLSLKYTETDFLKTILCYICASILMRNIYWILLAIASLISMMTSTSRTSRSGPQSSSAPVFQPPTTTSGQGEVGGGEITATLHSMQEAVGAPEAWGGASSHGTTWPAQAAGGNGETWGGNEAIWSLRTGSDGIR